MFESLLTYWPRKLNVKPLKRLQSLTSKLLNTDLKAKPQKRFDYVPSSESKCLNAVLPLFRLDTDSRLLDAAETLVTLQSSDLGAGNNPLFGSNIHLDQVDERLVILGKLEQNIGKKFETYSRHFDFLILFFFLHQLVNKIKIRISECKRYCLLFLVDARS